MFRSISLNVYLRTFETTRGALWFKQYFLFIKILLTKWRHLAKTTSLFLRCIETKRTSMQYVPRKFFANYFPTVLTFLSYTKIVI